MPNEAEQPPIAKRVVSRREYHGDPVVDEYAWLADRDDPDTMDYLRAESAFADAATRHLEPLREAIRDEFRLRAPQTELTVPTQKGAYRYYNRAELGRPYIVHCRVPVAPGGEEEVILDRNALAEGSQHFNLGVFDVSPDGRLLIYGTDHEGAERFTLHIKDLSNGDLLGDVIPEASYGTAWTADSRAFFYTTVDEARRPYRVWRHVLGTAHGDDEIVYEETDRRFRVAVALSRSQRFILITVRSRTAGETLFLPADSSDAAVVPLPRLITGRRDGVDYTVDHQDDRFLILHNLDAEDFELSYAPVDSPDQWNTLVPHEPGVRLLQVHAFAEHIALSVRREGLTGLRILPKGWGRPFDITFPEVLHTVMPGRNLEYRATSFRLRYSSLITPESIYDCDMSTGKLRLLKQREVLGDFRPDDYEQRREWAVAADGTGVPVSIVCRRDVPRDGTGAAVLYGYGAYEVCVNPWFSPERLSLLDRGVVFAIAHPRGGGELGHRWYRDGTLLAKKNTFTDFLAVADHLVATGWTAPHRLVLRGSSAGGLLVGAAMNLAPDRFAGVVAQVPFVDPLTTVLDPARPLTVSEWEEWGNPRDDPRTYAYMKSYSPYENLTATAYPPLLATAALNDSRVLPHEPAKWTARLRALSPSTPALLRVAMHAGHTGPTARDQAWAEEAFVLAWILDRLGLAEAQSRELLAAPAQA